MRKTFSYRKMQENTQKLMGTFKRNRKQLEKAHTDENLGIKINNSSGLSHTDFYYMFNNI